MVEQLDDATVSIGDGNATIRRERRGPRVGQRLIGEKGGPCFREARAGMNQGVRSLRNGQSGPRSRIVLVVQARAASIARDRAHVVVVKPAVPLIEADKLPAPDARTPAEPVIRAHDGPAPLRQPEHRLRLVEGKRDELEAMHDGFNVTTASPATNTVTHVLRTLDVGCPFFEYAGKGYKVRGHVLGLVQPVSKIGTKTMTWASFGVIGPLLPIGSLLPRFPAHRSRAVALAVQRARQSLSL